MWKAVENVRFQMDAREVYQAIVRAGDAGPVVNLSANGVRFTCRPRPGGVRAGLYCILLEASLVMEPSPAVHYGLIRAPEAAIGGGVQSLHTDLVVARLVIRQIGPGCSEGILEIAPYLELPEENARCLATLAVQHVSGSAFYQLCEPLMRGLVADGGRALVEVESWPLHREVAGKLGHGGVWLPDEAVSPDIAAPRVITAPCPGRPRGWEDDWASEQVDLLGRDPMEVYAEWLDLMPRERRTRLKDPLNSFRNALSFRRRKRDFDPPLRPPVK